MNTRKQLTNRILSLVLTFVMVVGVLPMTVIPARAAELEHIEIDFSGNAYTESPGAGIDLDVCFYCYECDKTIAPGENDGTHSFTLSDFSYDIKKSGFRATLSYQVSGCLGSVEATDVVFSSDFRYGGYKNSNCTDGAYSFFTKFSGDYRITMKVKLPKMLHDGSATCCTAASCSTCGHSYTDASNHEQPDTFICRANTADSTKHNIVYACCGAVKETEPHTGEVSYTVNATDKTKHDIAYSCCQGVAETVAHQTLYTVTAKNTLKETCALGCGHTATATLTAEDSVYTGSAITTASITYSENWLGNKADASAISYGDNVNAGVVDVSANIQANVLLTSFTIQRADIAGATVTLSPAQTQYTGDAQEPDIAVVWNGRTLSQDKDYTVSWDKTGLTESGTYAATIAGIGNFTGAVEKTFTIQPANFGGMTAEQIGTLTYNKTAQIPQVDISAVSVNDQPITITYSTQYEGPFGSMPGVTNAGTHIIYYKLSAPNHNDEIGQVRVYVDYGIPDHTPPVAKDLTYDGTEQALIIGGSVEDGQMLYGFDQIDYFPQIPTKTEAGEYTVHYVIPASMNYDVLRGTVTVQIKKADQDAPTVGKTDETISKKCDGSITGVDETMEYRAEGADTYTAITGDTVTGRAAGTYYVRCKGDNNHNPSADTKVTIAPGRKLKLTLPQETPGYTLTATAQELDWAEQLLITLDIDPGYTKTDSFAFLVNGVDRTSLLLSGGTYIDIGVTKDTNIQVTGIADITPPTANISVKDNSWTTFWNGITFGLFFNETQQVTITAADVGSGVDTVEYFLSEHALEQDALTHKSDWQTYTGAFHIDPDKVCAIYAKVTDKAGNIFYLNSDGLVLDATAPAISGIEDGKTYYTTQKVTVSDNNLDTVTLNSEAAAETITLEGNKDGVYTITATDKAGNATSVTVTMKPISAIDDDYQDVTPEDATSGDRQTIKQTLELIETLLQDDDLTEAEKTALEEARADAQALLDASQEKSPIPATGDATYLVLFGSLMVVSAAALVVLLLVTKKRKQ